MAKESFVIFKSFYEPIKVLSDEDFGQLFKALFEYQINKREPTNTSRIYMPFLFFKNQFRLDDIKYEAIVERNKINGSKGGQPKIPKIPKQTESNPNNPVGILEPKIADNDNDKDKDNVTVNVNVNDTVTKEKKELVSDAEKIQHPLQIWILGLKNVSKLKDQLTFNEAEKIIKSFPDKKFVERIFLSMENFKELNKKYTSVNLTFRNWAARENKFKNEGVNLKNTISDFEKYENGQILKLS